MGQKVLMGGGGCETSHMGSETAHMGGETFSVGTKRLTRGGGGPNLGQVVTATGAKRLEDGCEPSWGAKRLWCDVEQCRSAPNSIRESIRPEFNNTPQCNIC